MRKPGQAEREGGLTTRGLFLIVFGVMVLVTIARSVFSLHAFGGELDSFGRLATAHAEQEDSINAVASLAIDLETGIRGWGLTGDRRFLEPYDRGVARKAQVLERFVQAFPTPPPRERADRVRAQVEDWDREVGRPLAAEGGAPLLPEVRLRLHYEGKDRMDAIRANVDVLRQSLAGERETEAGALSAYRARLVQELWLFIGCSLALLVLLGWSVLRLVEKPLARLAAFAEESGDSARELPPIGGVREIRALGRALGEMIARITAENTREAAYTELVTTLSSSHDLTLLAQTALEAIVAMSRAAGGVLWIEQEQGAPLVIAASVAVDRDKIGPRGDAAARDAMKSGKELRIANVDGDVGIVLRSALVDVMPRAILVSPLEASGRSVGALELAGPSEAQLRDPLFVRALERVGLALDGAIAVGRLDALRSRLAEANTELTAQNEELRAQEEELRTQKDELVTQQSELTVKNEALTNASKHKNDFFSSMSHELRTPLNAVIGFAEVLLSEGVGGLNPQQREYVSQILEAGDQQLRLVSDVLDVAKIEAGRIEVHLQALEIAGPVEEACQLTASIASRKKVVVEHLVEPGTPLCTADPDRLRQVMLNLLSNAIKFTPEGGTVRVTAKRADTKFLRVSVADTGVGIAADEASHLFEPFSQLEAGRKAHSAGTGLGLSICKRLVELMGGSIGFESKPGFGSTFSFVVPITTDAAVRAPHEGDRNFTERVPTPRSPVMTAPPVAARAPASPMVPNAPAPIVAVPVPPRDARSEPVTTTAQSAGLVPPRPVAPAIAPQEALASPPAPPEPPPASPEPSVSISASTPPPLATPLPGRAFPSPVPSDGTPRAMGTRTSSRGRVASGAAASATAGTRESRFTPTAAQRPERTVLVVEDDLRAMRIADDVLTQAGFRVRVADTAEEALVVLDEMVPDLLVVDLSLPGMSGITFVDRVRERVRVRAVPILVLTARDLDDEEAMALRGRVEMIAQKGMMTGAGFLDAVTTLCDHGKSRPIRPRVLVIDDSAMNRRVVRAMLVPSGYEVLEAVDAESGIALAAEKQPMVVLMDMRMPGMDGLEATRRLRAGSATAQIPIVALTAQAMARDRDTALAAGCISYLAKPVGRRELLEAVEGAIGRPPASALDQPRS